MTTFTTPISIIIRWVVWVVVMVQKVVINKCFGGFSLNKRAVEWMRERYDDIEDITTLPGEYYSDGSGPREGVFEMYGSDIPRDHDALVDVMENADFDPSGRCAELAVVEIPDGVEWKVSEYDGQESVEEAHRSWA